MRRQDREVLQPEQIDAIIESCDCLRLGLNAEDGAHIVPLNFAYVPARRRAPARRSGNRLQAYLFLSERYWNGNGPSGGNAGGKEACTFCHYGTLS